MLFEKMLCSNSIFKGKVVNLRVDQVELPNGRQSEREVVEHRGAVAVVPVNDNNEIMLVQQYRYPAQRVLLEVPAGKIESNEDPTDCAVRELREETGLVAREMRKLYHFYTTPGFSDEKMTLFLARGLNCTDNSLDQDEFIQVKAVPLQQALEMVDQGDILDAKTIIGILAAQKELMLESKK